MEKFAGKSIFRKVAIGKIFFYEKNTAVVKRTKIEDAKTELDRFEHAKETAKAQLQNLYEKALQEVGDSGAAIFEVHMMMIDDLDYNGSIQNMIESQSVNAEYAVAMTGDNFSTMFAEMDDDYMKARAADVKDISERLVSVLSGVDNDMGNLDEPVILVADDLAPSETVQMDKSKLLAFVTEHGSSNSHTAILARTMNIPALIQIDIQEEWNGKMAVIDGFSGEFYIDPEPEILEKYQAKKEEQEAHRRLLAEQKGNRRSQRAERRSNCLPISVLCPIFRQR